MVKPTRERWYADQPKGVYPLWPTTTFPDDFDYPAWIHDYIARPIRLVPVSTSNTSDYPAPSSIRLPAIPHLSFITAYPLNLIPYKVGPLKPQPRDLLLSDPYSSVIYKLECQLYEAHRGAECSTCRSSTTIGQNCIVVSWSGPDLETGLYPDKDASGSAKEITVDSCWDCLIDGKKCDRVGSVLAGPSADSIIAASKRVTRSINEMLDLPERYSILHPSDKVKHQQGLALDSKGRRRVEAPKNRSKRKAAQKVSYKEELTLSDIGESPSPEIRRKLSKARVASRRIESPVIDLQDGATGNTAARADPRQTIIIDDSDEDREDAIFHSAREKEDDITASLYQKFPSTRDRKAPGNIYSLRDKVSSLEADKAAHNLSVAEAKKRLMDLNEPLTQANANRDQALQDAAEAERERDEARNRVIDLNEALTRANADRNQALEEATGAKRERDEAIGEANMLRTFNQNRVEEVAKLTAVVAKQAMEIYSRV